MGHVAGDLGQRLPALVGRLLRPAALKLVSTPDAGGDQHAVGAPGLAPALRCLKALRTELTEAAVADVDGAVQGMSFATAVHGFFPADWELITTSIVRSNGCLERSWVPARPIR
ncbi:MAG: hypothetical protein AAGK32_04470, partial [Actinomycetota bacterium]